MKLILTLTAAAALSACALTPEQKVVFVESTVAQIQAMNASGVDPINLEPAQLELLATGCALVPLFYPDVAEDVTHACTVIQEAAK